MNILNEFIITWISFHGIIDVFLPLYLWLPIYSIVPIVTIYLPENYKLLPEILKDVGFSKGEIILSEDLILHLIETYTNEAGVRKIKEKLVDIIRDVNLNRFHDEKITIPHEITKDYVKLLFEN